MKKIELKISDLLYEKFRFEAMDKKMSWQEAITATVTSKLFSKEVEESYNNWMDGNVLKVLNE